jgi:hypothetical protein
MASQNICHDQDRVTHHKHNEDTEDMQGLRCINKTFTTLKRNCYNIWKEGLIIEFTLLV